jgi:DtxR family Mn-dependent transcriptional regulator
MPSLTVENYLKAILQIGAGDGSVSVATGQLAVALGVSPGSVTSMLKTLDETGLATHKPYAGVSLTPAGRRLALRMLRRHRLLELFLARTLNLTWDQVHDEAEHMEHAVSDFLIDRIDEYLQYPNADPHGDPIPQSDGTLRGPTAALYPLSACPAGSVVAIERVLNQGAEFLRYLTEAGLSIGAEAEIEQNSTEAGVVALRVGKKSVTMGHPAAAQLLVSKKSREPT